MDPDCVWLFILALTLSAIYIPQLRLFDLFQTLIYVAVSAVTRCDGPWAFGVGVIIAPAWSCMNLFVTHLFQAGMEELWGLARTGHLNRPDTLMVLLWGRRPLPAHCCMLGRIP